MAMTSVLRRMGRTDVTVHGFRSTFRDWAAERTAYPNHVVEMALAHVVGNAVEAAYRRGDLLDKRRRSDGRLVSVLCQAQFDRRGAADRQNSLIGAEKCLARRKRAVCLIFTNIRRSLTNCRTPARVAARTPKMPLGRHS